MTSHWHHFRVWRGDAEGGDLVDYPVEVNEGEVVLDIIHRLQQTEAQDLAVRWNCKAGKCGSCSAEINGRPRLMCMTRMSTFADDEVITVTPLRTFPVMDSDWRHLLLVCSALGEDDVELVRREQVPMRPDLLDLFELDELKKYFTGDELGGHRAKESM